MIYQAKSLMKMSPLSSLLCVDWRYWRFNSQRTVWGNKAADSLSPPGMRVGWRGCVEAYSNPKQWRLPYTYQGFCAQHTSLSSLLTAFFLAQSMESHRSWQLVPQTTCVS